MVGRRMASHHRHCRPRRWPPCHASGMRIDERRPRPGRRVACPIHRIVGALPHRGHRRRRGRTRGHVRPRLDRRPAGRAAHPRARAAHADRHGARTIGCRGGCAARPRRADGREGRHQRGDGRLPAGAPAVGDRRARGRVHRRVQHARRAGDHDARRAGDRVQRPRHARRGHEQRHQRTRPGQPCQQQHRSRGAADDPQRRRRPARRDRPCDARQPGQAVVLLRRGRGGVAVRPAVRRTRGARGPRRRDRVRR